MDPPVERVDDLFWLRDDERKNPEVIEHLEAENAYTEAHLAHVKPLVRPFPAHDRFPLVCTPHVVFARRGHAPARRWSDVGMNMKRGYKTG